MSESLSAPSGADERSRSERATLASQPSGEGAAAQEHEQDEGFEIDADETMHYDPADALRELDTQAARRSSIFESRQRRPANVEFSGLTFTVGTRAILDHVGGWARQGEVLAIMGPSGAGKTTLLDMLAGRLVPSTQTKTAGTILVNGQRRDFDSFRRLSAYVVQEDTFFPELTVRETITLAALLRLPRDMPEHLKHDRVAQVIAELSLVGCQDTKVGNELVRGISGGERKRTSIATELVTDPSLLFLDEPTTGLDSFGAQSLMQTLLKLAQNGRTVVATIHQPRSSIYQMFDMLMLVSEGRAMYFGKASEAVDYFGRLGYACPDTFNPADFFLDLTSLDQRSANLERTSRARIALIGDAFADHLQQTTKALKSSLGNNDGASVLASSSSTDPDGAAKAAPADASSAAIADNRKYATTWFRQFWLLTERAMRSVTREKMNNIAMVSQNTLFSVLLGLIWLKEGNSYDSGASVQATTGVLFFLLVNQAFACTFGIIFLFPMERSIVLKERASRCYHVGAYFWSKNVIELPRLLVLNALFCIVTYFMISLRSGAQYFFAYYVIVLMTQMASEGIAYWVSAIAADPQQAGAIAPLFIVTSMLFCGYLIPIGSIPIWLRWLNYVSFIRYGFALLMQNEFQDRALSVTTCDPNSFCPQSGDEVISFYGVDDLPFWANFVIMLALIVGLRFFAYVVLLIRGPKYDTSV